MIPWAGPEIPAPQYQGFHPDEESVHPLHAQIRHVAVGSDQHVMGYGRGIEPGIGLFILKEGERRCPISMTAV